MDVGQDMELWASSLLLLRASSSPHSSPRERRKVGQQGRWSQGPPWCWGPHPTLEGDHPCSLSSRGPTDPEEGAHPVSLPKNGPLSSAPYTLPTKSDSNTAPHPSKKPPAYIPGCFWRWVLRGQGWELPRRKGWWDFLKEQWVQKGATKAQTWGQRDPTKLAAPVEHGSTPKTRVGQNRRLSSGSSPVPWSPHLYHLCDW